MGKGMVFGRLNSDGVTQVDQFDPAECTMLVKIADIKSDNVVCGTALVKPW